MSATGTYLDEIDARTGAPQGAPVAPASDRDWRAYFRTYRENIDAAKAEVDVEVEPLRVLEVVDDPDETGLGRSMATLLEKTRAAGWETRVRMSRVHHPAALYMAASDEHARGSVKKPAFDATYWFIAGWWALAKVGYRTIWTEGESRRIASDAPKRPLKSKIPKRLLELHDLSPVDYVIRVEGPVWEHEVVSRTFGFDGALVADPVGMPTELYYEYAPAKASKSDKYETTHSVELKQMEYDRQAAEAHAHYNDGADFVDRRPAFNQAGPFNGWLDEALAIFTPHRLEQAA